MTEKNLMSTAYEAPVLRAIGKIHEVFLTSRSWGIEWQSSEAFLD